MAHQQPLAKPLWPPTYPEEETSLGQANNFPFLTPRAFKCAVKYQNCKIITFFVLTIMSVQFLSLDRQEEKPMVEETFVQYLCTAQI